MILPTPQPPTFFRPPIERNESDSSTATIRPSNLDGMPTSTTASIGLGFGSSIHQSDPPTHTHTQKTVKSTLSATSLPFTPSSSSLILDHPGARYTHSATSSLLAAPSAPLASTGPGRVRATTLQGGKGVITTKEGLESYFKKMLVEGGGVVDGYGKIVASDSGVGFGSGMDLASLAKDGGIKTTTPRIDHRVSKSTAHSRTSSISQNHPTSTAAPSSTKLPPAQQHARKRSSFGGQGLKDGVFEKFGIVSGGVMLGVKPKDVGVVAKVVPVAGGAVEGGEKEGQPAKLVNAGTEIKIAPKPAEAGTTKVVVPGIIKPDPKPAEAEATKSVVAEIIKPGLGPAEGRTTKVIAAPKAKPVKLDAPAKSAVKPVKAAVTPKSSPALKGKEFGTPDGVGGKKKGVKGKKRSPVVVVTPTASASTKDSAKGGKGKVKINNNKENRTATNNEVPKASPERPKPSVVLGNAAQPIEVMSSPPQEAERARTGSDLESDASPVAKPKSVVASKMRPVERVGGKRVVSVKMPVGRKGPEEKTLFEKAGEVDGEGVKRVEEKKVEEKKGEKEVEEEKVEKEFGGAKVVAARALQDSDNLIVFSPEGNVSFKNLITFSPETSTRSTKLSRAIPIIAPSSETPSKIPTNGRSKLRDVELRSPIPKMPSAGFLDIGEASPQIKMLEAFYRESMDEPESRDEDCVVVGATVLRKSYTGNGSALRSDLDPAILAMVQQHMAGSSISSSSSTNFPPILVSPSPSERSQSSSSRLRPVLPPIPSDGEDEAERGYDDMNGPTPTRANFNIDKEMDMDVGIPWDEDDDSSASSSIEIITQLESPKQDVKQADVSADDDASAKSTPSSLDVHARVISAPRVLTGISPAMRERRRTPEPRLIGRVLNFDGNSESDSSVKRDSKIKKRKDEDRAAAYYEVLVCDGCRGEKIGSTLTIVLPCEHNLCTDCLNAQINVVCSSGSKGTPGRSRCSACLTEVIDVIPRLLFTGKIRDTVASVEKASGVEPRSFVEMPVPEVESLHGQTTVLKFDNVAWDITPEAIEAFLPEGSLPEGHVQPVHILLERETGKSKDYLYIEVQDIEKARFILQTKQNGILGSGARARPCTITLSSHACLIDELRPAGPGELLSLLHLCQTALEPVTAYVPLPSTITSPVLPTTVQMTPPMTVAATPGGIKQESKVFLKHRYASFWALLSLLSKMKKSGSVIYWDMFHVSAGVLAVLAKTVLRSTNAQTTTVHDPTVSTHHRSVSFTTRAGNPIIPKSSSSSSDLAKTESAQDNEINQRIHARMTSKKERERTDVPPASGMERNGSGAVIVQTDEKNKDWKVEDEKMFHKFAKVFEEIFAVKVGNTEI